MAADGCPAACSVLRRCCSRRPESRAVTSATGGDLGLYRNISFTAYTVKSFSEAAEVRWEDQAARPAGSGKSRMGAEGNAECQRLPQGGHSTQWPGKAPLTVLPLRRREKSRTNIPCSRFGDRERLLSVQPGSDHQTGTWGLGGPATENACQRPWQHWTSDRRTDRKFHRGSVLGISTG